MAQKVNNLPAMHETQVWTLGWEDPLEKEMATHSNILAWKIPWTEEPGRLQFMGSQKVRHDWATNTHFLKGLGLTSLFSMLSLFKTCLHTSQISRVYCPHLLLFVCFVSMYLGLGKSQTEPSKTWITIVSNRLSLKIISSKCGNFGAEKDKALAAKFAIQKR